MAKKKYYYCIVNRENGKLLLNNYILPIYHYKYSAERECKHLLKYMVAKIEIDKLEDLIIKTKQF